MWWAAVRAINHALLSCAKLNREKEFAMSELGIGACMPPWPQPSEIKHAAHLHGMAANMNGDRRSSHILYICVLLLCS